MKDLRQILVFEIFLFLVLGLTLPSGARAGTSSFWIREVRDVANHHVGPFRIRSVAAEEGHLVGSATYRENVTQRPLEIEGRETLDGRFWPYVVAEVGDDLNGEWKKVEQLSNPGRPVRVTLKFYEANLILYINLDMFGPQIGKTRYGRVGLGNGEYTLFELNELRANNVSAGTAENDWEVRTLWGYLEDPLAKGPFFVGGISFSNGHLRAEAGYLDPEATSATVIEGTETAKKYLPEQDFWASATLQVANDPEGEWKTVGQAATPGKAATITIQPREKSITTLNVGVDILRPMIGKFGYGRAVLKNGKYAAFELIDLLPPNSRR